jgi:hypothetical protein
MNLQDNLKVALTFMIDPWQIQCTPKSLLVPPKFPYVTNYSPKPPICSPIALPQNIKHCSLVVMSGGGISYLITATKLVLMQNKEYIYSVLLDFSDNSNVHYIKSPFGVVMHVGRPSCEV